jgi:hypothetical protein
MPGIRRATGGAVAGLGIIVAVVVPAVSAHADPYTDGSSITSSTSNPDVNGPLTFSVAGMDPNELVDNAAHSAVIHLNTVRADANGAFTTTVTLPKGLTCDHTITSTGQTSHKTASLSITIGDANKCNGEGDSNASGSSGDNSALPGTGAAVAGLAMAGTLIAGTGLLIRRGGRRRTDNGA